MFNHLTPPKDIKIIKPKDNIIDFFVYSFLLLWAISLGIFFNSPDYNPSAIAFYATPQINISIKEIENKKLSIYTPKLNLFNFVIKTDSKRVNLDKLKLYVNGLYSLEFYKSLQDNLKLYVNGTQLGNIIEIDDKGYIYFNINHYPLLVGDNKFSLILENNINLALNDILQFSIEKKEDLVLNYNQNILSIDSNYPLEGNLFNFINKGYFKVYNLNNDNYLKLSNTEISLANFLISSIGESIYLDKFIINYNQESDKGIFYLKYNEQIISTGNIIKEDKKIVFSLNNFKLNQNKDLYFEITGILPEGQYSFSLFDIVANGFYSEKKINLEEKLYLNTVNIKDTFPVFVVNPLNTKLINDWNIIYDLNIKSLGSEIKLDSLVWDFKGDFSDLQVLINDEYKETNIELKNNKLTTKWSNLIIPLEGLNLKIRVKTKEENYMQIYLLEKNIFWADDNYSLPNFPLEPNILTR